MNHKLRVAAYCRVSTDKDDQTNSLNSQRSYFTDYIMHHDDWILNNIYYDEGISGTQTRKRAGFHAMIEEAMQGNIDLILTKEVCRFARNTVDTLSYTRKLKDNGIGVIFTIDNIDTRDSDGELRLTIMASIAQEESRKTSERVKWGQKRRMEQGIVFGRDLLGYTVHRGRLIPNKEEIPIVAAVFHKYTNEKKGTHIIARELSEEGFHPKYAKQWSNTAILRILRNEKYVGDLCQKKTYTPNYLTHAKKYNYNKEEMIYLKNHHAPIIDRDLWNRTQEELQRRSPAKEVKYKHSNRYWCSGKLYCGLCGQHFVSRTKNLKNNSIYKAWRCRESASHGSCKLSDTGMAIGCDNNMINERALLSCMHDCIAHLPINQNELKEEILQELRAITNNTNEKSTALQIQEKIDNLNRKKRKAIDLMLDGLLSKEDLQEQAKWYKEQVDELTATLAKAQQLDTVSFKQPLTWEHFTAALNEIMTFDETNSTLYREILDKIIIYPDNTLNISLVCIPFSLKVTYQSHGKGNSYMTEILNVEIV